jgi:hypothetical protein
MSSRWLWACLLVAACGVDEPATYTVTTFFVDGPRADMPSVFINGEPTDTTTITYPSSGEAIAATQHVELRYAGTVLAAYDTGAPEACDAGDRLLSYTANLMAYVNGVVGYADDDFSCSGGEGGGGDGGTDDGPSCQLGCGPYEQCSLRAKLVDPLFSIAGCTPLGDKQVGNACAWLNDPGGAYSDCAEGLLCVEGTCRAQCTSTCGACVHIDGMPEEITICP